MRPWFGTEAATMGKRPAELRAATAIIPATRYCKQSCLAKLFSICGYWPAPGLELEIATSGGAGNPSMKPRSQQTTNSPWRWLVDTGTPERRALRAILCPECASLGM